MTFYTSFLVPSAKKYWSPHEFLFLSLMTAIDEAMSSTLKSFLSEVDFFPELLVISSIELLQPMLVLCTHPWTVATFSQTLTDMRVWLLDHFSELSCNTFYESDIQPTVWGWIKKEIKTGICNFLILPCFISVQILALRKNSPSNDWMGGNLCS